MADAIPAQAGKPQVEATVKSEGKTELTNKQPVNKPKNTVKLPNKTVRSDY